ncbi:FAD-binding protein [Bosea sp. F3-2]|uniref:NAD(P)/FAD-dependent oxidoreductase n=1 Tax=Bosea sp. F3-2 TaxID=2599640 RepID=UPI0011ECBD2E|nr:NAD(P)/FAD-dependent oxidoreductase [Bosea sp. F3-2]QEL23767.1 FAD-binding protein [Bosea sp. F3-2]
MEEVIPRIDDADKAAPERYDAIVLGAGVSGLVSASVLAQQGYRRIVVVEEYAHIGGNHIDWSSGGYTFDIGSLIFQDDSPLLQHFPDLLPLYVPIRPRWARLNPQRLITAYPISLKDDILRAGPVEFARILTSAAYARLFKRRMRNAREFARHWIGARLLHRSGLDAYMTRFYGIASDQIGIQLARKRMQWIAEHASLRAMLGRLRRTKPPAPTNRQLARPREGFAALYAAAAAALSARGVRFLTGAKLDRIEKLDNHFILFHESGAMVADRIVSTIPIPRVQALCKLPVSHELETITLLALYFSFEGARGFNEEIIYNFSYGGAWKRLTMYSDFYGRAQGREYFGVEVIANHIGKSVARAEADFRAHVAANGLFSGDLRLEGSQFLDNAYPIYRNGADESAAEAVKALKAFGIESFGRQGGFNYQPTARVSTIEAEASLRRAPTVPAR